MALSGVLNGRYLRNELSQYLFNNEVIREYLSQVKGGVKPTLPYILIELFFEGVDIPIIEGNGNANKNNAQGISFKIEFDKNYQPEYEKLIDTELQTIPIEYYTISWKSFARESITSRSIPIKSVLIDSSSHRYQNGSDIYISRIIKENLDNKQKAELSQAYRKVKDTFMAEDSVRELNQQINENAKISEKNVKVSVDLSTKNAWETSLITYVDEVPFHQIGKGEQSIIKTNLALSHKKSEEANVILLEEPENHLSHSKLNEFVKRVIEKCNEKQIIISTHNSFVANKLGLENLILLNNGQHTRLSDLEKETYEFFKKLPGYETLRMVLCKKAILVEGDCDELIVQKCYKESHDGKLPIEDGIDVISVKLTFDRFLEIAEKISSKVAVVTDNDWNVVSLEEKYKNYIGNTKSNIDIFYDEAIDSGDLKIGKEKKDFNYNTLEPKLLKVNDLKIFNTIFKQSFDEIDKMHTYMKSNKTKCALKLFETSEKFEYPKYIKDVIKWCDE